MKHLFITPQYTGSLSNQAESHLVFRFLSTLIDTVDNSASSTNEGLFSQWCLVFDLCVMLDGWLVVAFLIE